MLVHRSQPSTAGVELATLVAIGGLSAGVMMTSDGALQWASGAAALAAPALARRSLQRRARCDADDVVT